MKRKLSFVLAIAMLLSVLTAVPASALNYTRRLGNEASFETMEEARETVLTYDPRGTGRISPSCPALAAYPEGTTYIYRSADLYGVTASVRMNTNLLVYVDKAFDSKDAALEYMKGLGVIDLVDKATGSAILVTPIDKEKGFTDADEQAYYLLQTAMFSSSNAEYNYYGGFGYRYVIGIDGGATFLNDFVASELDYVSRNAGMLLIGGSMNTVLRDVAGIVPAYLVNPQPAVVEEYKAANGTDAFTRTGDVECWYNQQFPLRKVAVKNVETVDEKALIEDVYYNFFIKAMRVPVLKQGLHSAGTLYKGYNYDEAPYSLCERNAIIDGKTADGIIVTEHVEDRFADIPALTGEYLETWYELLPEEVVNGTAGEHTVPLWLANHGGGDDPIQFCDEIGLLALAGKERFAMVAPYYQSMYAGFFGGGADPVPMCKALCAIVHYMLDTYPALDPSRVYVTGYSLGGGATFHAIMEEPSLFAAAIPMSAAGYEGNDEQKANYEKVDLPLLLTTSTYDLGGAFSTADMTISTAYQATLNRFLGFDGMKEIEFDFDKYPLSGFAGDIYAEKTLNGEHRNYTWFQCDDNGAPMVGVSYTANLIHALYPEFGKLAWDWARQFSRNQETLAIEYNPYQ